MFSIKDRQRNDYKQSGERCLTQLCHFLTTCIFYKVFTAGRFAYTKFPFSQAKGVISTARVGWFPRALTCFARSNIHIKNYSAIARRKNIPFYPARTGINFSYFQLARRSFRFPSQLTSQCFFFQLAQILPDERVFCRAAPSGTPVNSIVRLSLLDNWVYMGNL